MFGFNFTVDDFLAQQQPVLVIEIATVIGIAVK
jgi:hypothetical protein